jgi:hypothetical protein
LCRFHPVIASAATETDDRINEQTAHDDEDGAGNCQHETSQVGYGMRRNGFGSEDARDERAIELLRGMDALLGQDQEHDLERDSHRSIRIQEDEKEQQRQI